MTSRSKARAHSYRNLFVLCLLSVSMLLSACASGSGETTPAPSQSADELMAVRWTAVQIAGSDGNLKPVIAGSSVTAEFKDAKITGTGGVNTYTGSYTTAKPDTIAITGIAATLMAGDQALMDQETAYFAALENATKFAVTGDQLALVDETGKPQVTFTATKPAEVVGTTWYCTGINNGKQAVVSLEASSEITADFGTDGNLSGSGGVNQYNGEYTLSGTNLSIGPLMTTKMAGPENLMAQETMYLAALAKVTTYRMEPGDTLALLDDTGAAQARYSATKP